MNFEVVVSPDVLEWAVARSGRSQDDLSQLFPYLEVWLQGTHHPTYQQLEDFALATLTPFGCFFLETAPKFEMPIPDFRSATDQPVIEPDAELLEMIYICQRRQEWYRQYSLATDADRVPIVGYCDVGTTIKDAARDLRDILKGAITYGSEWLSYSLVFPRLIGAIEAAGVLVMLRTNSRQNVHMNYAAEEFSGFVLSDPLAPLVAINSVAPKPVQIFSLLKAVALLSLGQSGIWDHSLDMKSVQRNSGEVWSHKVATHVNDWLKELLVIPEGISEERRAEGPEVLEKLWQVGHRFAAAIVQDTRAGNTSHRDAFRLLDIKKYDTFVGLSNALATAH